MPINATIVPIASFAIGTANLTSVPVRTGERGLGGERTSAGKRAVLTIMRSQDGVGANPTIDGTIAVYGMDIANPVAGRPVGNAFATALTPIAYPFLGDGTTKTFQTNIPYAAFSNNNWLVEMPGFTVTGTFSVTTAGVVATAGGTAGVANQTKLGDVVIIGGFKSTITAYTDQDNFTITPAPAAAISIGAACYNVSVDRRFKTYIASVGTTNPELFTVTSGATIDGAACGLITFAIAPPKLVGPSTTSTYVTGTPVDVPCVYFGTVTEIKPALEYRFDRSGIRSRAVMWATGTAVGSALSAARVYLEHGAD
jgi:hypothetical protein